MDIKQLDKLFECKTVSAINRLTGMSYDILEDVKEVRNVIIKELCDDRGLTICDTDEDIIQATLSVEPLDDFQSTLANHGVVVAAQPSEPMTPQTKAPPKGGMERIDSYEAETAARVLPAGDFTTSKPIGSDPMIMAEGGL